MTMAYRLLLLFAALCSNATALTVSRLQTSKSLFRSSALRLAPLPLDNVVGTPPATTQQAASSLLDAAAHGSLYEQVEQQVQFDVYHSVVNNDCTAMTLASTSSFLSLEDVKSSFTIEEAGKWFFVLYVGVSMLAGFKEFGVRLQKWLQSREK